jgi:hypothetical protein
MTTPDGRRGERGATAVMVALLLVAIVSLLALVMNVGHLMTVRAQLHNATDSAALAAARELNGTEEGLAAAKRVAANYAFRHETDSLDNGEPRIVIDPDTDVKFGHWWSSRPRESAFEEIAGRTPGDLGWINAVLVGDGRETARGNEVDTIMGGLFTRQTTDVTAESVAVFGGACESYCSIPIAFSTCIIQDPITKALNCDSVLEFNSDNTDNIGFTNLADSPTITPPIVSSLVGNGEDCTTSAQVDDNIGVTNGNSLGPVFDAFSQLAGKTVTAPVVYLGECGPEAKFVAHATTAPVVGFVSFTIQEVFGPPVNKIILKTACQWAEKKAAIGGCTFFGTTPTQPRLVR